MKNTGFLQLGTKDLIKGLIVTIIATILTGVLTMLNVGEIPLTLSAWKPTLIAGIASGLAYIVKNFLTNDKDQFLLKDGK